MPRPMKVGAHDGSVRSFLHNVAEGDLETEFPGAVTVRSEVETVFS